MENDAAFHLSGNFRSLNVNAPSFVPNINAPVFVPSFLTQAADNPPAPPPTVEQPVLASPNVASPATSTTESSPTVDVAPSSAVDESPSNPPPVDSWEEEADKETEEDMRAKNTVEPLIGEADGGGDSGGGFAVEGSLPEQEDGEAEGDAEVDGDSGEDCEGATESAPKAKKKVAKGPVESKSKKEHINVVFIGHVDAGKSTIGGQIMYLTGMVDKRTLEKYEREAREKNRESWYLSWALDTNLEEREKGKTVEVGRAFFETDKKHFTILDAPGHKSFVPNMIGGASQSDLAVLVISARKGEFETGFEKGGQTREHAMLAKTAGVKHLIVLINKMDDPTVNWDEERYNECKDKLLPYLKKLGFNPQKDLSFMPCSGLTGAGLKEPVDPQACPWYRGSPFIPFIDELPPMARFLDRPFLMPIVDKYKDMGTVVMGKVEAGEAKKGQTLLVLPNKTPVTVDQLWSDEDEVTAVGPGENVKIKLKGVEEEDISSGFVLCDPSNVCKTGRIFDAQVVILEHKSIICAGYSAVCHIHTVAEEVTVKALLCLVDKKTNEKSKQRPRFVKQDQIVIMRLEAAGVICMESFKDFPQMGRFTLRDEGRTIAIGKVLKVIE